MLTGCLGMCKSVVKLSMPMSITMPLHLLSWKAPVLVRIRDGQSGMGSEHFQGAVKRHIIVSMGHLGGCEDKGGTHPTTKTVTKMATTTARISGGNHNGTIFCGETSKCGVKQDEQTQVFR